MASPNSNRALIALWGLFWLLMLIGAVFGIFGMCAVMEVAFNGWPSRRSKGQHHGR